MLQVLEKSNGNVALSHINDGETLYVVFSARGASPGNYSFFRTFNSLKLNVLYVNSLSSDWYTKGLPWWGEGDKDTAEGLFNYIDGVIESHSYTNIVFLGSSMGAFGCLKYVPYFSGKIPFKYIIFGADIYLNNSFSRAQEDRNFINWNNIELRLNELDRRKGVFFYGELELIDSFCAARLNEMGFSVKSHPSAAHNVPFSLASQSEFVDSFKYILDNFDIPVSGSLHKRIDSHQIKSLMEHGDYSYKDAVKEYPLYALGLNRLGVALHSEGSLIEAEKNLHRSLAVAPDFYNTHLHLAIISHKLKRKERLMEHYFAMQRITPLAKDNLRIGKIIESYNV